MSHVILDCECYVNYFLATFIFESGEIIEYEKYNDRENMPIGDLGRRILSEGATLVTFNGKRYDLPIFSMALMGASNGLLKEASNLIIKNNWFWWQLENKYHFHTLQIDHIDIINPLPLFESLKLYGARNGTSTIQDLPLHESTVIEDSHLDLMRLYCRNDCMVTWELFLSLWEQIQLRVNMGNEYGQDLRSLSDAQIAEKVICSEYQRITGSKAIKPIDKGTEFLPRTLTYTAPDWVKFTTKELNLFLFFLEETTFDIGANGKAITPDWMKGKTVTIDNRKYAVGLGGLHSKNSAESYESTDRYTVTDIDVESFYPRLILNAGYEPPHMGNTFTKIFSSIVDRRVTAKRSGDKVTADTLKITINGTFGKLGSVFSAIYAPNLLLGVTFTGQLTLLMLIERLSLAGIQCVSANTDGLTLLVPKSNPDLMYNIVAEWEKETGFNMEGTIYKSIHYRDVNNYFALTSDNQVKTKGVFKPPALAKNPTTPICAKAAIDYVLYNKPMFSTIYECKDPHQFVSVRKVKGGAEKDGVYVGKTVRWYYSTETSTPINYISNGNKVAKSDGAIPMMRMPVDLPDDLDHEWYIEEAWDIVKSVGYTNDR